jgi:hypothetical protein
MKKSEMIRAAAGRVRRLGRGGRRECYCTPTRNMVLSLEEVAMNQLNDFGNPQFGAEVRSTLREMMSAVAEKFREALNLDHEESLMQLDEDDGDMVTDELVEEAFEKAALMYEEQGE